ncbi:ras-related protein RabZ-like [Haliotis rubra]|uniref:ras-related protein RabZ-like n=1 Tax=Haliotis rubra TaxID=36100 RepID=UPI001EE51D38|nr:ras-related protein RabZ-like [Haliotis rubra]
MCEDLFWICFFVAGGDIFEKELLVDGRRIQLNFVDTAGQADVKSLIRSIYRNANGIMVVFDITNQKSFDTVGEWMERVTQEIEPQPHVILVGNKQDLTAHREIPIGQARAKADFYSTPYYDVSAKTGDNVKEAFETFIRETWRNIQPNSDAGFERSIHIEETDGENKERCCTS